jgi:SAM-dependent MidA family methyltransferase
MAEDKPNSNGSASVEQILRRMIAERGPIPFATFMAIALTHPAGGYYATGATRPTPEGDFLTAPELHPVFGYCLAAQVEEIWTRIGRPRDFALIEYGAGSGSLALAIMEGLETSRSPLRERLSYIPIEINEQRRAELASRFVEAGHGERLVAPEEAASIGVVIANEFLDALPVHRLVLRHGRLRERYVDYKADRFIEVEGPVSDPSLEEAFRRIGLDGDGTLVEIRPDVARWMAEVAGRLELGAAMIIDYGGEPGELYGPHHPEGTVLAYRRHRVVEDVLLEPGGQDITAHVDFADLRSVAARHGLQVVGQTSLAGFLIGCGLEEFVRRAQGRPEVTLPELLWLRSAVRHLLDPRLLGGFQVLVLGRGLPSKGPLRGLAATIPSRNAARSVAELGSAGG